MISLYGKIICCHSPVTVVPLVTVDTTIDNRSGLTCAANGFNSFTAPTQTAGYMYFRLVGQQIGAYNVQGYKMAICLGLQGIYKIV
jgi:hypothetical protein